MNSFFIRWLPRLVFGVSLMYAPVGSRAQSVNLFDLVVAAGKNYPELNRRRAELAFAGAHETTVRAEALPAVVVQDQPDLGTVNPLGGSYFPFGLVPSVSGGNTEAARNTTNAGNIAITEASWEFFGFGYYRSLSRAAHAVTTVAGAELDAAGYRLREQVILAYMDWLRRYKLVQIRSQDAQRDSVVLSLITANVRSGLRPGADSSTALATYSGARIAYLRAQSDYEQVRNQIEAYTGEKLGAAQPDTQVVRRESIERLAGFRRGDTLYSGHPLLSVYARRIDAQLAQNKADENRFLPRLALTGAYWVRNTGVSPAGAFSDGGFQMPYSAFNYLFGLSATVALSDLWLRHDHKAANRYLADAATYNWEQERLELATLAGQAHISLTATLAQLDEIPIQQMAARNSYQQQLALYRAGLNTLTDVTNAEYTLLQAETNLVVTQAEALKLEYLLAALGGNQDLFTEQFKH